MMFNFITEARKITHWIAAGATLFIGWAVSDKGQAVIGGFVKGYPKLSGIATGIGVLAALYFSPKRTAMLLMLCLGLSGATFAQTPAPLPDAPTSQRFVISAYAAGYNGQPGMVPVSIMSAGVQLTEYVSVAATSISNPADSKQPRYSLGDVNVHYDANELLPGFIKKRLLIDTSNYVVTFQGSIGKVTGPNLNRIAEGVGVYVSRPLGNHVQASAGYRALFPGHVLVKIPLTAGLNFTF